MTGRGFFPTANAISRRIVERVRFAICGPRRMSIVVRGARPPSDTGPLQTPWHPLGYEPATVARHG